LEITDTFGAAEAKLSAVSDCMTTLAIGTIHAQDVSESKSASQRSKSFEGSAADSKQAVELLRQKSAPPLFVIRPGEQSIQFYKGGRMTTIICSAENAQSWVDDLLCPAVKNCTKSSDSKA